MYTYGTGKYVGVAMEKAGAKNVAEALKGYKQAKIEDVIKYILLIIYLGYKMFHIGIEYE